MVSLMPPLSTFPLFAAASVALLMLPGPAVLFIVARSGAQGRRAGLVSVLGVHTATIVHVLAAAAGLSAIVVASAFAFTVVKVFGGCYLIYIGIRTIRGARQLVPSAAPAHRTEKRIYAEAFVVNLFNPKTALFFLAFIPQFVERGHGPIWSQTMVLGGTFIAIGLCTDSLWAVIGASVGGWFNDRASRLKASRYAEGGILVGLGLLTLVLPHRPKH
jgi:threonine/homoserine/homoserine lactone efflux protein